MHINDNLSNSEKQDKNTKSPHMFQKSIEEPTEISSNFDENNVLEEQAIKNMSKIAKSFKSHQNKPDFDNENTSLVFSTNKLIDINIIDSTKPLYEYFEEIRNFIKPKEVVSEIEEREDRDEINDDIEVEEDEVFNIEEIIKNSEKEIFNSHDKKTLLKELINDVSNNSTVNFTYDNDKFEENIKEMLSEVKPTDNSQDTIIIEAIEPIVDNAQNIKRSKFSVFLLFTLIIVLGVAFYIYKDIIFDYISNNKNVVIDFVSKYKDKIVDFVSKLRFKEDLWST